MSAQEQVPTPFRPIVDPNSFDLSDLWDQTYELTHQLPGVYVAKFQTGTVAVHATVGWSESQLKQLVTVEDAHIYDLPPNQGLGDQIMAVMGNPQRRHKWIMDTAPRHTSDPDTQQALARRFLPTHEKIILDQSIVVGESGYNLSAEKGCPPTQDNVERLARVNLSLATLIGRETAEYEEILARAKVWSPADERPFRWL